MKHLGDVVCAIIEQDGHFLIAQRPARHHLALKWEFPGGKVAVGETLEEALKREILEELMINIEILSSLPPSVHSYDTFSLKLIPFLCSILSGSPIPTEHSQIAWVNNYTVMDYDFAAADIPILKNYLSLGREK